MLTLDWVREQLRREQTACRTEVPALDAARLAALGGGLQTAHLLVGEPQRREPTGGVGAVFGTAEMGKVVGDAAALKIRAILLDVVVQVGQVPLRLLDPAGLALGQALPALTSGRQANVLGGGADLFAATLQKGQVFLGEHFGVSILGAGINTPRRLAGPCQVAGSVPSSLSARAG